MGWRGSGRAWRAGTARRSSSWRSGQMRGGDPVRAVEWWSRLAGEDPYNSRIALRYMQALVAAGDRAAALRHAKAHSDLLRSELDAAPEREVVALAERLRLDSRPATNESAPTVRAMSPVSVLPDGDGGAPRPAPTASESGLPAPRNWAVPAVLALAILVGLGVLGGKLTRARAPEARPQAGSGCHLRESHRAAGPGRPRRIGRRLGHPRRDGNAAGGRDRPRSGVPKGKGPFRAC